MGLADDEQLARLAIEGHVRLGEQHVARLFDGDDDVDAGRGREVEALEPVNEEIGVRPEDHDPLVRLDRVLADPVPFREKRLERGIFRAETALA